MISLGPKAHGECGRAAVRCAPGTLCLVARGLAVALTVVALAPTAEADPGERRLPAWSKVGSAHRGPVKPVTATVETRLVDATISTRDGHAVLKLTLEGPGAAEIAPSLTLLKGPPRVSLDLGAVQLVPELKRKGTTATWGRTSVVTGVRFGIRAANVTAVMIDLAGPVAIARAEVAVLPATDRTPDRAVVTIDLQPSDPATFEAGAVSALPSPAHPAPPQASHNANPLLAGSPRAVVVIDAGHGGTDPGAIGANGLYEKAIVLEVAQRLKSVLSSSGRFEVVMTRDADTFVSLPRRVAIADAAGADVFVSIHADSISDGRAADAISGASVYTLSERASSEAARRLAEKENAAGALDPALAKVETPSSVRDILLDLTRRETESLSAELRAGLVGMLKQAIKVARDPNRSAAFFVLRQTRTPSVLVELGYLTNPRDEALMASSAWQEKVALAIAKGIETYFTGRRGRTR